MSPKLNNRILTVEGRTLLDVMMEMHYTTSNKGDLILRGTLSRSGFEWLVDQLYPAAGARQVLLLVDDVGAGWTLGQSYSLWRV